ncbi:MAG: AAA family ATPase [bacterium]|nr:AAA family ATPase [bacterium]
MLDVNGLTVGNILEWAANRDWMQAMAQCMQEPEWHAEGDVWTHTQMVLEAMNNCDEWKQLPDDEQGITLLAALLHDVAKPLVSRVEDGRIRTKKHGLTGSYQARRILRDAGIQPATRERIVRLIRYHSKPVHIMRNENHLENIARLSWHTELPLMYILAKADISGSESGDLQKRLDWVELFKMAAVELECFHTPFRPNDHAARVLFFPGRMKWDDYRFGYKPYENYCCTVTLMSGLPGAGKDYWINTHLRGTEMVSLDGIRREMKVGPLDNQGRVVQEAKKRIKQYLAAKTDFVFNAVNSVWQWRRNYISIFRDYGARVKIVYVEPPWNVLLKQNRERKYPVPEKIINKKFATLDVPDLSECHELETVF